MKCIALAAVSLALALALAPQAQPQTVERDRLSRDERVNAAPTAASLAADGRSWDVPLRVTVFEPELDDPLRSAMLAPLRAALDVERGTPDADRFAARARLFFVDHERGKHVPVRIGELRFRVGPTAANGTVESTVSVPVATAAKLASDGRLEVTIGEPDGAAGAKTIAWLVGATGRSIVSDVDDTLKVTGVGSHQTVLQSTFVRELEPIPGMAGLLTRLRAPDAAFHYVSLSPWQLAPVLEEFLGEHGFPGGSLHLQPFRVQDRELADLVGDSRERKLAAVEPLLQRWPERRFVLVGDAGQLDPEVYGELARRHPDQVERILIRDPAGIARDSKRWAEAFAGVPDATWTTFTDPSALELGDPAR